MIMIFFVTVFTLLVFSVYSSHASEINSIPSIALKAALNEALSSIRKCNSNICFALDGSGSVNRTDFANARSFVQSVTNQLQLIPGNEQNSAVQFGKIAYPITLLTDDLEEFNILIEKVKFRGDSATSVGAGIVTCDAILALGTSSGPNRIVVITDGRNNFGGNPVGNADIFRNRNPTNRVSAIGIGNVNGDILKMIAGTTGGVFTVRDYLELFLIVNKIVRSVCLDLD